MGRRSGSRNVKLVALAADGTVMELHPYVSGWHLDPLSKAGRGICSATMCEGSAAFLTSRSGRAWALCWGHAQLYANGTPYWRPGMAVPESADEDSDSRHPRS
jgi:hypothetical protein